MTISTTSNATVAQGNGLATSFSFSFPVPNASWLQVYYTDTNGVTSQLLSSQFSVSGIGSTAGGSVTYPISGSPIPTGSSLIILRVAPYQQLTDLVNQSGYYPDVVEAALDNLEMQIQQLAATKAIHFPIQEFALNSLLPVAASRALKALIFDSAGNASVSAEPYQEGSAVVAQAQAVAEALIAGITIPTFQSYATTTLRNGVDFTAGSSTSVTLPSVTGRVISGVFFDAYFQSSTQWSLSGNTLSFNAAIPNGISEVNVMYFSPALLGQFFQNGYGAIGRTFQDKMRETVSASDFGADPTGVNSSVTAINNAIIYCSTLGGGCVELSNGDFLIDASIAMHPTVSVVGKGQYATRLVAKSGFTGSMVQLLNGLGQGIRFGGLSLIGNGGCNGFETGSATEMAQHVSFFDMLVFGLVNGFLNSSNYGYYDSSFDRVDFQNCTGVACDVGGSQNVFERCTFGNNFVSVQISEQSSGSIGGPKFYGCTWAGNTKDVVFNGAIIRPTLFSGCWFETASAGIIMSTVSGQVLFQSLVFDGCLFQPGATAGGTGVWLVNAYAGTVAFRNCVTFNDLNASARLPSVTFDAGIMANGQWSKTGCYLLSGSLINIEPDENNASLITLNAINSMRRYANDAAAGAAGLVSGALYFNTTVGALSLKS